MTSPLARLRESFDRDFTEVLEGITREEFAALLDTAECAEAFLRTPHPNTDVTEDQYLAITNLHLAAYPLIEEEAE